MNIQISLFGLIIILVLYGVSAGLLTFIWLATRAWKWKWMLIAPLAVVLLAAPWADEVWIAWHFSEFCKSAGVHVTRKVEVDGYYDATTTGWSKSEVVTDKKLIAEYEKDGFRFRERNTSVSGHAPGKISHLERYSDGTWRVSILDRPTARYHYKFSDPRQEVVVGLKIVKSETIVVDSQTGDVIARDRHYTRYPGWVESLWIKYFGSGAITCKGSAPTPPMRRQLLYRYVLFPPIDR